MNIFNIHREVMAEYANYIKSFINIDDQQIKEKVQDELEKGKLWPEPLLQFNPSYQTAGPIEGLTELNMSRGLKDTLCGFQLYQHQVEALKLGFAQRDFIVTSGTGSGKSLTYMATIFNQLFTHPNLDGVVAIIVYPMNALINSQTLSLDAFAKHYKEKTGKEFPITYGQYTGQEDEKKRDLMRHNPPQILLTNYMMLELLLTRENEKVLRKAIYNHLRYLVFDELHTYRGRQGADVAMLIRRIKSQCQNSITCIGTSATMTSGGSKEDQKKQVADVATTFFGQTFKPDQIIHETLTKSLNDDVKTDKQALADAVTNGIEVEAGEEELRNNPLAVWLENNIALEDKNGWLIRKKPISVDEIVEKLANDSEQESAICRETLEKMVMWISRVNQKIQDSGSRYTILPYKLHQFISQSGSVYTTLEPKGENRFITLEPGLYKTDDENKPIFPNVFSRTSGYPFICVSLKNGKLLPREFRALEDDEGTDEGYLIQDESIWQPQRDMEYLPQTWVKTTKTGYRPEKRMADYFPKKLYYDIHGNCSQSPDPNLPYTGWYMKAPLKFDPTSGTILNHQSSEATKLSKLGSEGRSTSTTITTYAILNQLHKNDIALNQQKLLSFTDNRQDAALQAGHFNNFSQITRFRSAIYKAVKEKGQLTFSEIGDAVYNAMALPYEKYANTTASETLEFAKNKTKDTFKKYLTYKTLEDLRLSWRIVLPNLEQCALLEIDYQDLKEIVAEDKYWEDTPIMNQMTHAEREEFLRNILDYFRYEYALYSNNYLTESTMKENIKQFKEKLRAPWNLEETDKDDLYETKVARIEKLKKRRQPTCSLSKSSGFGKYIQHVIAQKKLEIIFNQDTYEAYIKQLMNKLEGADYLYSSVMKTADNDDTKVYQLKIDKIIWKPGDEKSVRVNATKQRSYKELQIKPNDYFMKLYKDSINNDRMLNAQDHTGQLSTQDRQNREEKFRAEWFTEDKQLDTKKIKNDAINVLYCSPTMELGVDIGGLSVVHMRNAPPNPANYAQRSGRAGRSGQGALIFTYCSGYSPHDRHYFQQQAELVAGAVKAPRIDLKNEELLQTHLNALTLSEIGLPGLTSDTSNASIEQMLDMDKANKPLKSEIIEHLKLTEATKKSITELFQRCIHDFEQTVTDNPLKTYDEKWVHQKLNKISDDLNENMNRWRTLYQKADKMLNRASATINSRTTRVGSPEHKNALRDQYQAKRQIGLLCNDRSGSSQLSEFYPYRYLASEGFLPGYNFTRLPVRVFIPNSTTGGEYISRPRQVALREFGPLNILYYNGRKYQINQMITQDLESSLTKAKIATPSGFFLEKEQLNRERCPFSDADLSKDSNKRFIHNILELSESRTRPIERISCEEEERSAKGFNIQTYFSMDGRELNNIKTTLIKAGDEELLRLRYITAARLIYINDRWRSQKEEGFPVNKISGHWKAAMPKTDEANSNPEDYTRVKLMTTTTADAIYIEPIEALGLDRDGVITLQYALKRAIVNKYQVEQNEMGTVIIGDEDYPNILIYESAEGSLGILSQLINDVHAFNTIVEEAITICRYDDKNYKAPASYDDLLSYYNQMDHQVIDRFKIKEALGKLRQCKMEIEAGKGFKTYEEQYRYLLKNIDPDSSTEKKFLKYLYKNGLKLPDEAQKNIEELYCKPDFYYEETATCIFCDGSPHDREAVKEKDERQRSQLMNHGYDVWSWHYREDLKTKISERTDIFKKVKE